ncbi:SDR family oxidoreductase [Ruegeria arenilitoris]|nr:SDR family NAD(P)-dependent oxidoreductase [Ruegeria arenilitoris]
MSGDTKRKTLVVGATGGMGHAVAQERARQGDVLALVGRDRSKLLNVAQEIGEEYEEPGILTVDLADMEACAQCIDETVELMGGLDTLIFCAGVHARAGATDADLQSWDHILDVNFRSFAHLVRSCIDPINSSGHGAVIAIGSITSAFAGAGMNLAAKRALAGLCETLFEDVREFGTKVSVIHPGFVATSMSASPRLHSELMIQPKDISNAVSYILQSAPTACPTEIVIRPQRSPYK